MKKYFFIILFISLPLLAYGQNITKIIIHHETGEINIESEGKYEKKGHSVKLSTNDFKIIVDSTNTFLYTYEISSEDIMPQDAENLTTFLTAFGPYLLDITSLALPSIISSATLEPDLTADIISQMVRFETILGLQLARESVSFDTAGVSFLIGFLENIRDLKPGTEWVISDTAGVGLLIDVLENILAPKPVIDKLDKKDLDLEAVQLSEAMNELNNHLYGPTTSLKQFSNNLFSNLVKGKYLEKDSIFSKDAKDASALAELLKNAYDSLRVHTFSFSKELNSTKVNYVSNGESLKNLAPYEKFYSESLKALEESELVFAAIAELKFLVSRYENNKTTWEYAQILSVSSQKGKTITLKIKPVSHKLLAVYAEFQPKEYTIEVTKLLKVKPTLGLSLFVAPNSTFSEYGTKETDDGKFEIIESTIIDNRVDYGLTLGLQMWKNFQIETLINPLDKIRSFGLGIGYSLEQLHIGIGFHWTRHQELLTGQSLGGLLDSEGDLLSEATYNLNKPKIYFSISFKGWAPFINK